MPSWRSAPASRRVLAAKSAYVYRWRDLSARRVTISRRGNTRSACRKMAGSVSGKSIIRPCTGWDSTPGLAAPDSRLAIHLRHEKDTSSAEPRGVRAGRERAGFRAPGLRAALRRLPWQRRQRGRARPGYRHARADAHGSGADDALPAGTAGLRDARVREPVGERSEEHT